MFKQNKSAFTLVELIVVITILVILGTIAFISLQGYSSQARDSKRISDIQNIKTSLELFSLNTGKYPTPDTGFDLTYDTDVVWTQGVVGDNVTTNLSRNLNSKPIDPLTETEYTYSVIDSKTQYELLSDYESDLIGFNNLLNQINAINQVYPKIDGNYNQIFVKTDSYYIPTPSIINSELDGIGGILSNDNIDSQIITGGENNIAYGTNDTKSDGLKGFTLQAFSGVLDIDSGEDEGGNKVLLAQALITAYSGTLLANEGIYKQIINSTDLISLIDNVVLNYGTYISTSSNDSSENCNPGYSGTNCEIYNRFTFDSGSSKGSGSVLDNENGNHWQSNGTIAGILSWASNTSYIEPTWDNNTKTYIYPSLKNNYPAFKYCEDLDLGGFQDWRLPNVTELESIVDIEFYPTINTVYFTANNNYYWNSTTDINTSTRAGIVSFDTGTKATSYKTYNRNVRCIR